MHSNILSPRLLEILLQHLQIEEKVLQRVQDLAQSLAGDGFRLLNLVERQADVSCILSDVLELQIHRQHICRAIARTCGCNPATVRLSHFQAGTVAQTEELDERRKHLVQLAVDTRGSLQAAEKSLQGWSGIVNFVLSEVLDSTAASDRYGATGHRLAPLRICNIDVRS